MPAQAQATANAMQQLSTLRAASGAASTTGLPDELVAAFLERDPSLSHAIALAHQAFSLLNEAERELLRNEEISLCRELQKDYINFYEDATINPYVALAAHGPWLITAHGAVVHDNGGYGMLGFGHSPTPVLEAMAKPWVMANVMTPSFTHRRFTDALFSEIGHARADGCPYTRFVCVNSGSESVTVAMRLSDIQAKTITAPGARHAGRTPKILAIKAGFHGRTDRPAQASDSSRPKYKLALASFAHANNLVTVPLNDTDALKAAFAEADAQGWFYEILMIEPVMGEGNPGQALDRGFYDVARALTKQMGTLLLVDSIQAGLRCSGTLSFVDYPAFTDAEAPDLETYSKALNAGQFPLSVLAVGERAEPLYVRGVYGNTMTTNPRALEVGLSVLAQVTPELRKNICDRGVEFLEKLQVLSDEMPGCITKIQGTGLLLSAELAADRFLVVGYGGIEEYCRRHGVGVIHGGANSLRFTPHFRISSAEIDLVVDVVRAALKDALASRA